MFRKYSQMGLYINTSISTNRCTTLKEVCAVHLPRRWAGHSKWQNIKSTKELMDKNKSNTFGKLSQMITAAVKRNGESPSQNSELRKLLEDAQRANMPKATIQRAISAAKTLTAARPYWVVYSGPRGFLLGFEVIYANTNPHYLRAKLNQTKKLNLKMEVPFQKVCNEKGVIIINLEENAGKSYETALEDGIEIDVTEVHQNEDKMVIFECVPDRVDSIKDQLSKRGYIIHSASTELEFENTVQLTEEETENLERIISKLQEDNEEILRVCHNIEEK